MEIRGSKILVLGGWGLVGAAICHKLMQHGPSQLIVSSLKQHEAEEAVELLRKEYSDKDPNMFVAKWGNIFTRVEWKDINWGEVLKNPQSRTGVISDIFNDLDDSVLSQSTLYNFITENKVDLVIDCINTATAIAYQDLYTTSKTVIREFETDNLDKESVERLLISMYMPQLIRHVQIMYRALLDAKSTMYLKIGTSGTGGMGLNIPYTHSEERPSRVLLSKTAVAGAQTLLLFLMARTPGGALVKEIKPTAAIAWKKITYDKVMRKGQPIPLVDMKMDKAHKVSDKFTFSDTNGVNDVEGFFKSVFIDTGENGIFSKGEFQAISALGQMELVTPEEIAEYAVFEIRGGNSGKDIMQALDAFALGSTYRAGLLQNTAMKKINQLEKDNDCDSIAFELLGPPRLSKLLFEAYILKRIEKSIKNVLKASPEELSKKAFELINTDDNLRSQMLSIGLVVLLPDGKTYLRGKDVKIPAKAGLDEIKIDEKIIDKWCFEAWVDLRTSNFVAWQKLLNKIKQQAEVVGVDETGSRYTYTRDYWDDFEDINEGKIVGWVFEFEDEGWRFKH